MKTADLQCSARLDALLQATACVHPDAVALLETGGRRCTYAQLDAMATEFADRLRAAGICPGDRVGLCAPKRIETVAALFGVLKAGGAYVSADPAAPASRSAALFADCTAKAVLVATSLPAPLGEALAQAGYAETVWEAPFHDLDLVRTALPAAEGEEDLAYILYTSGSTGRPKGVAHSHASAMAFIDWCSQEFTPTREDRFSSHAPFHFDLSVLDIYLAAKHAAALLLIASDEARQPRRLAELIAEHRLTFWYSTPAALRSMVDYANLSTAAQPTLRIVCFAGEVFPARPLRALARSWPQATYYNLYGPTETNVCTFHRLENPAQWPDNAPWPIGRPCSGNQARVTRPDGAAARPGEEGELLVHGGSVMKGYWGAPEKDREAFTDLGGLRWYRTGDRVVELDDSVLLFRGRRDRMIKRRGYRIELGEIEAALARHEQVPEAAVVATEDLTGETRIVAFYAWTGAEPASLIKMKQYANTIIPSYMCPDRFERVKGLKYTSTGKVDYQLMRELARGLLTD